MVAWFQLLNLSTHPATVGFTSSPRVTRGSDLPIPPLPDHSTLRTCSLLPQARLPHGIAAIRDHIESVDNVPLLVSLFTDATPATTRDMLKIYQDNDECTLAVGMSHRCEVQGAHGNMRVKVLSLSLHWRRCFGVVFGLVELWWVSFIFFWGGNRSSEPN